LALALKLAQYAYALEHVTVAIDGRGHEPGRGGSRSAGPISAC